MLQLSRFVICHSEDNKYYMYCLRNGTILELSERLYSYLLETPIIESIPKSFTKSFDQLIKHKFLIKKGEDEAFVKQLEFFYLKQSYQSSHLSLTVLPTNWCNLVCPYCFEKNKKAEYLEDNIQSDLIKFIESHSNTNDFSVTWFGGEPLLRPDIIENLLEKFQYINKPKFSSHSIVSNGVLINDNVIAMFKRFPLSSFQITLDGNRESHDKLRIKRNGEGTFRVIIENIKRIATDLPETHLSIRVNVGKHNQQDFRAVYLYIQNLLRDTSCKSYNIYPGILKDDGNKGDNSGTCFNLDEQHLFFKDLSRQGLNYHAMPKYKTGGCVATSALGYVIGANGDIYKCWEDVGQDSLCIGNVKGSTGKNLSTLMNYMLDASPFKLEQCRQCVCLPICGGGCPKLRVKHITNGTPLPCSMYLPNQNEFIKKALDKKIKEIKNSQKTK